MSVVTVREILHNTQEMMGKTVTLRVGSALPAT